MAQAVNVSYGIEKDEKNCYRLDRRLQYFRYYSRVNGLSIEIKNKGEKNFKNQFQQIIIPYKLVSPIQKITQYCFQNDFTE